MSNIEYKYLDGVNRLQITIETKKQLPDVFREELKDLVNSHDREYRDLIDNNPVLLELEEQKESILEGIKASFRANPSKTITIHKLAEEYEKVNKLFERELNIARNGKR